LEIEMQEQPNVHLAQTDGEAAADRSADDSRSLPAEDVSVDQLLELEGALHVRWMLNIVKDVAALVPVDAMPTSYQAAWANCCEEIFFRATGERWHMDEDEARFARAASSGDANASA
jgi:hypothetical protein